MTDIRPVLIVPHYNHVEQFEASLDGLMASGVPLLVVDDGSIAEQLDRLQELARASGFTLVRHGRNQGKGDAVMTGFDVALGAGYTHGVQVDADGQHDPADVPRFIDHAVREPGCMICGAPVFGADVPLVRKWGRKLTDLVVAMETWSLGIRDSLCGFRVYPLRPILAVIRENRPGAGMDFDAEILVLAHWAGLPIRFIDTRVVYPDGGVSHFHYLRDNLKMVLMHTRLLLRAPVLAWRRRRQRVAAEES